MPTLNLNPRVNHAHIKLLNNKATST